MKRLIKKAIMDYMDIQQGDYVDFGAYGKMYVCNTDYSDNYFWVTDSKKDRANTKAQGWSMDKDNAINIIEQFDGFYNNEEENRNYSFKVTTNEILNFIADVNPSVINIVIQDEEKMNFKLNEFRDIYEFLDELSESSPESVVLENNGKELKLI